MGTLADSLRGAIEGPEGDAVRARLSLAEDSHIDDPTGQDEGSEEWESPVQFSDYDLPQFTADVLPAWLRDYVKAESVATQTPLDLPGMLALSACAAAVAKKAIIQVRPGWVEPLNIWTVTALDPGNRKTAVFADIAYPIEEYEQAERDKLVPEIERAKNKRKIAESRLNHLQSEAAKKKDQEAAHALAESNSLAAELASMEISAIPELIADDISPEAVVKAMADQGGKIAIMSSEGDIFDILAGRYSNGTPNLGNFLKGHAGDAIRVKRVNRPPEYVKNPALTMGLAVQPEVLRGLMEKPGFRGRGLLGRFLYSIPVSPVGSRRIKPPPVPANIRDAYRYNVLRLLKMPQGTNEQGQPSAYVLRLSQAAEAVFNEFETWLEPLLAPFAELGNMADWAGKLAGVVARLTGLLHMAENIEKPAPWNMPILQHTVAGVVKLAKEYLIPHARAAYAEMGANPNIEAARCVLEWISRTGKENFSKRDLFNGVRRQKKFSQVKDLEPALTILIEYGYIRELQQKRTGPGKPASNMYEVNPHTQYPQYPHNSGDREMKNNIADIAHIADMEAHPESKNQNSINGKTWEVNLDDI